MKKLKIIITTLVLFCGIIFLNKTYALTKDDLISVGNGIQTFTVNINTKVEDIIAVLGNPKVTTNSAFGGHAYSFYTDDNFSNYLYIETTYDGKIISFGSVDPTYKTNTYSYGDEYNYFENKSLSGFNLNYNSKIIGGIYYNRDALFEGNVSTTISRYIDNFTNSQTSKIHFLRGISEQSVTMYNAISANLNSKTRFTFNEDFFYINEQLKENNSSISSYFPAMGKSNYIKSIGVNQKVELSNNTFYVFNPLCIAILAIQNRFTDFGDRNIAIMDYDIDKKIVTAVAIKEDAFDRHSSVELTQEEFSKLSFGRNEYEKAIENLTRESEIYDVVPQYTDVSTLRAGKLKSSKKQGITDYINAIRVAGGIPKLRINEDAFSTAQHISTLMSYRFVKLGLPLEHVPNKPEGVSDEYYNIAIGKGKEYSENLGYSAVEVNSSTMMYHINLFLDDSTEKMQKFAHRSKLLDSRIIDFGYGTSYFMFANEFGNSTDSDVIVEAWPSNGITFLETLVSKRFNWTAQFRNKYRIDTNKTTITVKCLNTNETWNFDEEISSNTKVFERYGNTSSALNNKVIFYDSTIVPEEGYVYEITLHNVIDRSTNRNVDYTYRSAFEYADISHSPTKLDNIKIQLSQEAKEEKKIVEIEGERNLYYVPIGEEIKLEAVIDSSVIDKKITWISSNEKVKVTQNGTVIARELLDEDVTITVVYDGSNITDEIIVRPYIKINQVKLEPIYLSLNKGENSLVQIAYLPDDANEPTSITWKIKSESRPNIEYDINDEYIKRYIEVETTQDKKVININAIDAESNNNRFTIVAHVVGISGEYTGECVVNVGVPLEYMKITYNNEDNSGLSISSGSVDAPGYSTINFEDFYNNNKTDIVRFKALFYPENTTISKNITWRSSDESILSSLGDGKFKIKKAGMANIIVKNEETGTEAELMLTVNNVFVLVETLYFPDSITSVTKTLRKGEYIQNQVIYAPDSTNYSNKIRYESSNANIATVDNNGRVKGISTGIVTITAIIDGAYTLSGQTISTSYNLEVIVPVESISTVESLTFNIEEVAPKLNVTINPEGYSDKVTIEWKSNNTDILTIDSTSGKINPIKTGRATVKVTVIAKNSGGTTKFTRDIPVVVKSKNDPKYLKGDLDRNGVITANDASVALDLYKNGNATVEDILIGDMDDSGTITANDASMILDMYKNGK